MVAYWKLKTIENFKPSALKLVVVTRGGRLREVPSIVSGEIFGNAVACTRGGRTERFYCILSVNKGIGYMTELKAKCAGQH